MANVVKTTIEWGAWDLVCPFPCLACGELGGPICLCCKKYWKKVLEEERAKCVLKVQKESEGCFNQIFIGGFRRGLMDEMIKKYKYSQWRIAVKDLSEILMEIIPNNQKMIVVPLPTIARHIRERGFDHAEKLAIRLARKKGWRMQKILRRMNQTVQVGADAATREKQARQAYGINGKIDKNQIYLLLDDVWTTGASMRAAARTLALFGVKKIAMSVLAVSLEEEKRATD